MAHSQRTAAMPSPSLTRTAAARPTEPTKTERADPDSAFAGSLCPPTIILPPADYDAFAQALSAEEKPNEKLATGAEWFRQNGF